MFWIGFTKDPLFDAEPGEKGILGLLMLGSYEERFVTHTWNWSERDYAAQWRHALTRALEGKLSALITDMRLPTQSSHLVWWPMWKVGRDLVFHNQLLFFAKHSLEGSHVDVERLYELIGKRMAHNSEGTPVSEWHVPVRDVEAFLKSNSAELVMTQGSGLKRLH